MPLTKLQDGLFEGEEMAEELFAASAPPLVEASQHRVPSLAIVLPTYNERDNVPFLIDRLRELLGGLDWEAVFVDDDSPDGTADLVREYAAADARIRLIYRLGRRGLASASLEGMLATTAEYIVVMDSDLQHDEGAIPAMLDMARCSDLDLVVATRNSSHGSMGEFPSRRVRLSQLGRKMSSAVCRCDVSDPMSGFFLIRREYLLCTAHSLQGRGFKTLADILASGPRPVRIGEVGYVFRARMHGDSKLDAYILVDYLFWIVSKVLGRTIPTRFAIFGMVGSLGVAVHLTSLYLLFHRAHLAFASAQLASTYIAMTGNFILNNAITYRDRKLRGSGFFRGLVAFWVACSLGALANVSVARSLLLWNVPWIFAGLGGIAISSVWNYVLNDLFTWNSQQPKRRQA
jgi:dolichol-phosphate mannosyltransferase